VRIDQFLEFVAPDSSADNRVVQLESRMLCGEVLEETLDGSGLFLVFDGHCVNCSGRQCGSELWNAGQQSTIATRSSADAVGNTAEECEALYC
jgi:hypothetical protein